MVPAQLTRGHIFDIQGFSVHDGPGCRTLVFFKGCSLECAWCSNPEGISFFPEPLYRETKCTFDGLCVNACPHNAITISKTGDTTRLSFNRTICAKCNSYACARACCSGALNIGGYEISVEELYLRINRDRPYWGKDGGITLTGGEPFAQPEFAHDFLKRCYDAYIHTAVETCGNVPWTNYEKSLPYLDWIFFDLKIINGSANDQKTPSPLNHPANPQTYQLANLPTYQLANLPTYQLTNLPTYQLASFPISHILENARRIAGKFSGRLVFRLPVIPGFNDHAENIQETARFIHSIGRNEINILPLHHLGREKYGLLDKKYYTTDFVIPGKTELQKIADQFASLGITCYNGSETPF